MSNNSVQGTPIEICERYALGRIDRAQLVGELGRFPYATDQQTGSEDELLLDPRSNWQEVLDAADRGLIDDQVYADIFNERYRSTFEQRWPELFAPLSSDQYRMVLHPLAARLQNEKRLHRHEVVDLIDLVLGKIAPQDYQERH